ncbi:hypothetical protein ANCCEY_12598 [Ancylostoma ceylanicum]|uniref:Uncharacterized protein n=1 Tax=Ancylostoma ceylanicum TaxID=53326 RepID=A0A0D6LL06_9BILA|nr:hypothetical protein ANCCEY_12598 [Ancylostoma ceylanicum]
MMLDRVWLIRQLLLPCLLKEMVRSLVLTGKLMAIVKEKAPEAIPLLDELITILQPNPKEIVENEKSSRRTLLQI